MCGKEGHVYHCGFAQIKLQAVLSVSIANDPCLRKSFCSAASVTHSTPQKEQFYSKMIAGESLFSFLQLIL